MIARDERFDKFFLASDFLRERLDAIRLVRAEKGEPNIQPTFADITKTHSLYVRTTYKPFVSIASEYSQVRPSGDGTASLGQTGGSVQFRVPIHGHFMNDMALHISIDPVGTANPVVPSPLVQNQPIQKNLAPQPAPPQPLSLRYAYTSFPGLRIVRKAQFCSDEVIVSEYTRDDVVMYDKFFVLNNYEVEYDRCMGQQPTKTASFFNSNGFTQLIQFTDGAQTAKFLQDRLDLWIPLQFDFCLDPSRAILNDLISNTQRVVNIDLAPLREILRAFSQLGDPDQSGGGDPAELPFSRLKIDMSLYVNNIYVNPEIHDVFSSRLNFQLIRVWRNQTIPLQKPKDRVLLDQLKYPAEFMMVGIRDKNNVNDFDNWFLMGRPRVRTNPNQLFFPAVVWNPTVPPSGMPELVVRTGSEGTTFDPIIKSLGVTAHGITLFPEVNIVFYSSYLPLRYYLTNAVIAAPDDSSCFFIPFCLFPGQRDPSGYYNLSSSRELYVTYSGTQITADAPGEMFVTMSALNFILRKGDSIRILFNM